MSDSLELNPDDPFEAILIKMVETNRRKRADYAGNDHFLANFYNSARQLRLTPGHSVEQLIATKQARLNVLLPRLWGFASNFPMADSAPMNESIDDTLLDRAVYAVLALCIWNESGYVTWPDDGLKKGREGSSDRSELAEDRPERKFIDPLAG